MKRRFWVFFSSILLARGNKGRNTFLRKFLAAFFSLGRIVYVPVALARPRGRRTKPNKEKKRSVSFAMEKERPYFTRCTTEITSFLAHFGTHKEGKKASKHSAKKVAYKRKEEHQKKEESNQSFLCVKEGKERKNEEKRQGHKSNHMFLLLGRRRREDPISSSPFSKAAEKTKTKSFFCVSSFPFFFSCACTNFQTNDEDEEDVSLHFGLYKTLPFIFFEEKVSNKAPPSSTYLTEKATNKTESKPRRAGPQKRNKILCKTFSSSSSNFPLQLTN